MIVDMLLLNGERFSSRKVKRLDIEADQKTLYLVYETGRDGKRESYVDYNLDDIERIIANEE